jgi:signal transduction histidine kinase
MGVYNSEIIDLCALLAEVVTEYSSLPGTNVKVNYTKVNGCYVNANILLKDVFVNLVDNAIKHSDGSPTIKIEVNKIIDGCSSFYKVAVEDNGPGISDEMKGEVFHRLKRGQTQARGRGLGLYIVKTLVNDFHGQVWAEDRVQGDHTKGARFIVMLPAIEE